LIHPGEKRAAPQPGEILHQPELAATLRKLIAAERQARAHGKDRKAAIYAAYDRFYKGDIAQEIVRSTREQGGLFTMEDLANWKVHIEEPVHISYKGIEVYKLTTWTQGPAMLQALNILENFDLKSMGYNSSRYIHTVYQAMNLAFADRDFYYGDPYFSKDQPMKGLLSKDYAKERAKSINFDHNDAMAAPGDPYPYEGKTNPFTELLRQRARMGQGSHGPGQGAPGQAPSTGGAMNESSEGLAFNEELYHDRLWRGTTSIEAAD